MSNHKRNGKEESFVLTSTCVPHGSRANLGQCGRSDSNRHGPAPRRAFGPPDPRSGTSTAFVTSARVLGWSDAHPSGEKYHGLDPIRGTQASRGSVWRRQMKHLLSFVQASVRGEVERRGVEPRRPGCKPQTGSHNAPRHLGPHRRCRGGEGFSFLCTYSPTQQLPSPRKTNEALPRYPGMDPQNDD